MSKQFKEMAVRYKPLVNEGSAGCKWESSLDKIFSPGCYALEIDHTGDNVGLPVEYCGEEHYIVGSLTVTDSGTNGLKQHDRVIGQSLTFTTRNNRTTKVYTRTFAAGEWSPWSSLAEAGMFSTANELIATVESLFSDVTTLKGNGEGSVSAIVDAAVSPVNGISFENSKKIHELQMGDTAVAVARDVYSEQGKVDVSTFLKRTTAGHTSIHNGYAELRKIGGNIVKNIHSLSDATVKINAQVTKEEDRIIVTRLSSENEMYGISFVNPTYIAQPNHKYYSASLVYNAYIDSIFKIFINDSAVSFTIGNGWHLLSAIRNIASVVESNDILQCLNAKSAEFIVANHVFIDLTEMYGGGNEPTLDECDKLFATASYMPSGINVASPVTYESVGYNQCDVSKSMTKKHVFDSEIVDGANTLVVMPCLPCKLGVGENNGYIIGNGEGDEWSETAIRGVFFTMFNPLETSGKLYLKQLKFNFCELCDGLHKVYLPPCAGYIVIETTNTEKLCAKFAWSGDRDYRDYEPYIKTEVKLPQLPQSEWGLAGIAASGTAARDTIDLVDKKHIKRIGRVNLGELEWTYKTITTDTGGYNYFQSKLSVESIKNAQYGKLGNILTKNYTIAPAYALAERELSNNSIMLYSTGTTLYIRDDAYTSVAEFTATLSGQYLYYELAEPEVYDITDDIYKAFTASDYGCENFTGSSVFLCDNVVFFMRSLAGEMRNLLDKLYDTFSTTDISTLVERIHSAVEPQIIEEPNAVAAE